MKADRVSAKAGRTWYDLFSVASDKPLIVLVSGLGAQAVEQWDDPLCIGLAEHGYNVLRFDNRGMRGTEASLSQPGYSIDDLAADALSLVASLKARKPFHLVGASMGGMIAQAMALRDPTAPKTLTCVFSAAHGAVASPSFPWDIGLSATSYVEGRLALATALNNSDTYPLDRPRFAVAAGEAERRGPQQSGIAAQIQALSAFGSHRAELKTLTLPVLVAHGDRDPLIDPRYGLELAASFAPGRARHEKIDGMGHFLSPGAWLALEPILLKHFQN